jgi:hypothetical protein
MSGAEVDHGGMRNVTAWAAAAVLLVGLGAGGCGGSGDDEARAEATPSASETGTSIEGRWEQVHTCDQLVTGLETEGLAALAPGVAGDYFPDSTPEELTAKDPLCAGAEPQRHAHFFTADGRFGSLDQTDQQVDDASFTVEGDELTIGDGEGAGRFRFEVSGDSLVLLPQIADSDRDAALADPLEFSVPGWQVAVSYEGLPFQRVPCGDWC